MSRPAGPITRMVDKAIDSTESSGTPLTLTNVRAQIDITTIGRMSVADLINEMTRVTSSRVAPRMRELGYLISDGATRERKAFGDCSARELLVNERIKRTSIDYDRAQFDAQRETRQYLERRSKTLGRTVTVAEVRGRVEAIYATHGIDPPATI